MSEFISLIDEFFTSVFDFNVFVGIIVGIVVLIIELVFIRMYEKKDKRKESALNKGHVIHAQRISMWDDGTTETSLNSYYHAKYQYNVSGKNYIYKYMGKKFPPVNITLYYKNDPRHVWSDLEKKQSPLAIFLYLMPLAAAIAVVNILGGV